MELKTLVFILLSQILISKVFGGEILLPFTEFTATVIPVKPNSASTGQCKLPPVPKVPNLSESVLEYFKSHFPDSDRNSPLVCTFSAPLVVTSTSIPIPPSKFRKAKSDPGIQNLPPLSFNQCEANAKASNPLSCTIPSSSMPIPITVLNAQQNPIKYSTDINLYNNQFTTYPQMYDAHSPQVSNYIKDSLHLPLKEDIPILSPIVLPESLPISKCSNILSPSSIPTVTTNSELSYFPTVIPQNIFSIGTSSLIDPSYYLPYPLRYEQYSLPEVMPPSDIGPLDSWPNSYPESCPQPFNEENLSSNPFFVSRPFVPIRNSPNMIPHTNPSKSEAYAMLSSIPTADLYSPELVSGNPNSMYLEPLPLRRSLHPIMNTFCKESPECKPELVTLVSTNHEFDFNSNVENSINSNIEYLNNYDVPYITSSIDAFVDTFDCNLDNNYLNAAENIDTYLTVHEFNDCIPASSSIQEICVANMVPEIPLGPLQLNQNPIETCVSHVAPSTYVRVIPFLPLSEASPNVLAAIDNTVFNIAKNITSNFMSYLKTKSEKEKCASQCNPFNPLQCKANIYARPVHIPSSTEINPVIYRSISSVSNIGNVPNNVPNFISPDVMLSMLPLSSSYTNSPCDDKLSLLSPVMPKSPDLFLNIMELPSVTPPKVSDLASSQKYIYYRPCLPCQSCLQPPMTTNLDISLPVLLKTQGKKLKSLKNKPRTLEKFLELLFLAELLNDDEDIDWDAIDTVFKLLCIT